MTETLIQETLKYEAFSCPEQDVLNLYMKDKGVTIFPIEFNDPVNIWGHHVDYKKAKIIHFWSKYEVLKEDEHMVDKTVFEIYERLFRQKIQN